MAKIDLMSARERLVKEAMTYMGRPAIRYDKEIMKVSPEYGMSPLGFDCSGFPTFLLEKIGFPNPESLRHASEYFDRFGVPVQDGLQGPGDLVFFSWNGIYPQHMGIMIAPERYVHAHQGKGKIETFNLKRCEIEHEAGKVIIYNKNPIGFKRLALRNGRFHDLAPYPTG